MAAPTLGRFVSQYMHIRTRRMLADNPATPPNVLATLAGDPDVYVRRFAARNTSTPPDVLATLATDEDEGTRHNASGTVARLTR